MQESDTGITYIYQLFQSMISFTCTCIRLRAGDIQEFLLIKSGKCFIRTLCAFKEWWLKQQIVSKPIFRVVAINFYWGGHKIEARGVLAAFGPQRVQARS